MKKIYLIQYTLKEDSILVDRIKSLGPWMSYFSKSWIVESDLLTAKAIYDRISQNYETERILIMELNKSNYWGVMPKEAWEWLTSK